MGVAAARGGRSAGGLGEARRRAGPALAVGQRAVGAGLTGVLALGMVAGCALFAWSIDSLGRRADAGPR